MRVDELSKEYLERFRNYLGKRGCHFFRTLIRLTQTPGPVLRLNEKRKGIPVHCVHFREGMQVRNWMRRQPETQDWNCHQLDNNWMLLVLRALKDVS